jgi:hypothetical protein
MSETVVDANAICGTGFPTDEGIKLADALLERSDLVWKQVVVDVHHLPPGLLISAFFNGFLQRVFEKRPARLSDAREVKWILAFGFQRENVAEWMKSFIPNDGHTS